MKNFWKMSYLDFKAHLGPFQLEEFLTMNTMYPFLTLVFYCLLARFSFQTQDLTQWVVGNSYLLCTNVCIFSLGISFYGERCYGRIRSIVCSPISKIQIMIQKGVFPCFVCVITTFLGFLAGGLLFQLPLGKIHWGMYFVILLLAMLGACALGLFLGTIGLLTDQMHLILNTMSYVMLIFTGANFSVSQLPFWGRMISQMLPLSRSIKAANMLFADYDGGRIFELLLGEFIVGLIYLLAAKVLLSYTERKAIRKGCLEIF